MTMMTWKRTGSGLIAGAATALLIATTAPALAATPTWSVKPGGNALGKAGTTVLLDTKTGQKLTCKHLTSKVTLKKGHHLAGAGIGLIKSLSFTGCTGPFGLTFTVQSNHLPWKLNAVSYNKAKGITSGTITGIHATLKGNPCSAQVDGTGLTKNNGMVKVTYNNHTHKLIVLSSGGNLHVYKATNCAGLINSGDPSKFSAVNAVTPLQTITSP